jgi:uncharacterized protein (TIGR02145 family)
MRRYIKLIVIISTFAFISCEKDDEVLVQGVAVDLGLSVKWANCNVGASTPEEYGDYFAWGEVHPKNNTYTYGLDSKTLPPHADAATVNWGGAWRMPTDAEWTELREQCTWTWTTQNGVYGRKVTSKTNGNSIFLPAAGYLNGSSLEDAGSHGFYWSSSLYTDYPPNCAWYVGFNSDHVYGGYTYRHGGRPVRPVCP